jgi:hypothetical protein
MSKYLRKKCHCQAVSDNDFNFHFGHLVKKLIKPSLTFTEKPMLPSPAAAFQNCTHQANLALGDP